MYPAGMPRLLPCEYQHFEGSATQEPQTGRTRLHLHFFCRQAVWVDGG